MEDIKSERTNLDPGKTLPQCVLRDAVNRHFCAVKKSTTSIGGLYFSTPHQTGEELEKLFHVQKHDYVNKNKVYLSGLDSRGYGAFKYKDKEKKVRVYKDVHAKKSPFVYIGSPSIDDLNELIMLGDFRVNFIKYNMVIHCEDFLSTRFIYDIIYEHGYFSGFLTEIEPDDHYRQLYRIPAATNSYLKLTRKKEKFLNTAHVHVRETSSKARRPDGGYQLEDIDRVRISIWHKPNEGSLNLRDFIPQLADITFFDERFDLRAISQQQLAKNKQLSEKNSFLQEGQHSQGNE